MIEHKVIYVKTFMSFLIEEKLEETLDQYVNEGWELKAMSYADDYRGYTVVFAREKQEVDT